MDLSKQEKVETLMINSQSLSFEEACRLLGYDPNDPQIQNPRNPLGIFSDIFGEKK